VVGLEGRVDGLSDRVVGLEGRVDGLSDRVGALDDKVVSLFQDQESRIRTLEGRASAK
jgi:hypothetical protein